MTGQRARSSVEADHRSAHPDIPGVPWWGAILIAVAGTALGFAIDAMSGEEKLSGLFAGCYAAGCVTAVLAVRYSSIFTAVVQPPLILFAAIPTAYLIMSTTPLAGSKSTALTIGYPLVERFPLMISTALGVLIIGVVRWYWGMFTNKPQKANNATAAAEKTKQKAKAPRPARPVKSRGSTRSRVQAMDDIETTTARTRRPARDVAATREVAAAREPSPPTRPRHSRHEAPIRHRPAYETETRRTPLVSSWEDESTGRAERRASRRIREDYDEYGYGSGYQAPEQPRYREPSREPVREPLTHRPRVRYRDEEPPISRRRPEPWDQDRRDPWDYDR